MIRIMLAISVFSLFLFGCASAPKKKEPVLISQPSQTEYTPPQEDFVREEPLAALPQAVEGTVPDVLSPKQIQRCLKNAGYYQGPVDGKIGPKTRKATREFQEAKGLKADGIVGKRTTAKLGKYLNK